MEITRILIKEKQILMDLFFSTHGRNWINKDHWGSNEPVSAWHGVQVDELGRVIALTLDGNNLQSEISSVIYWFLNMLFYTCRRNPGIFVRIDFSQNPDPFKQSNFRFYDSLAKFLFIYLFIYSCVVRSFTGVNPIVDKLDSFDFVLQPLAR